MVQHTHTKHKSPRKTHLQRLVELHEPPVPEWIPQGLDVLGDQLRSTQRDRSVVKILLHSLLQVGEGGGNTHYVILKRVRTKRSLKP